ncbi:MAG TPA: DNA-3-methyladenine glycosylase [Kofleriaceae bacterium]|nr:DNA-3-methyladenine glycosylase [Kofleriaceae bacterium]
MSAAERLSRRFFARPADVVAHALIGQVLVCGERAGIVVETEAYLGPDDKASHARFGATARTSVMFGPGGVSYVYLIYGMYDMFNIVTGRDGEGQAVLVRAAHPERGIAGGPAAAAGPGKLCRAFGISRARHHGVDLTASPELFLARGSRVARARVARGPRIGIDYAGEWAPVPLRFWLAGHPAVSRAR